MPLSTQLPPPFDIHGRAAEIDDVAELLERGRSSLVTITGRGGVGKTALAGAVVRALGAVDRCTWVPLTGVSDPELVLSEIATALGAHLEPGDDMTDAVAGALAQGSPLLVLDNAEHLLPMGSLLADLVRRCDQLRILVTSQTPLRLLEEQVVAISPLPLPDGADETTAPVEELRRQPAVAIYCERAAAVDHDFALTDQNAAAVTELCRVLEGLPLAIELAAARAASLPADEILRLVESEAGIGMLRRRRNDVHERHHGVVEAIDWTYRLLTDAEQRSLRRLSVVVGTFDVDTVLGLLHDDEVERSDLDSLDDLSTLVDFHLVDPVRDSTPPRFAIPHSIRAFALGELERRGETDQAQRQRLRIRAQQSRVVAAGTESGQEERLGRLIEADRDDLMDAIRLAISLEQTGAALDIARGLGEHWDLRGYGPVQRELLDAAIALGARDDAHRIGVANAMLWSAYLELRHCNEVDHDLQTTRIQDAEAMAANAGDDATLFHSQCVWLLVCPVTGDMERALRAVELGLEIARRNENDGWRAVIQVWAGMLAGLTGDTDGALELGIDAISTARRNGDLEIVVKASLLLGALTDQLSDKFPELPSTEEALGLARDAGLTYYETILVVRMAESAVRSGDREAALHWMAETLQVARTIPGSSTVNLHLLALASTAHLCGDPDRAAFFFGSMEHAFERLQQFVPEAQRLRVGAMVDDVRSQLGPQEFARQVAAGSMLSPLEAVAEGTFYIEQLRRPEAPPSAVDRGVVTLDRLTARQLEVLRLLAAGLTNKEIASELGVRAKTVMHHTAAIYRELGVRGRGEAAALAFRAQLVD